MFPLRTIIACALVAGCAAAAPQGEPVAPEAYISAIRGNTQVGRSPGGANWRIYIADDLSRRGVVHLPTRSFPITGRVAARANGVCSSSPELRNGEERCYQIFRSGNTYQSVFEGTVDGTLQIVSGNPYGL